ncbi:PIR Superfamily Protein [Plasmodium ovale wallikeri]|uniref:PIR Superfamily Protein n=1 Tax=Plasmodium ovale wallikeri TaxID=864142 RepID=A0A1A9AQM1_PLAOA|nr:PIR Superfamily Protein [Plasmodium ovale wallikeri]
MSVDNVVQAISSLKDYALKHNAKLKKCYELFENGYTQDASVYDCASLPDEHLIDSIVKELYYKHQSGLMKITEEDGELLVLYAEQSKFCSYLKYCFYNEGVTK